MRCIRPPHFHASLRLVGTALPRLVGTAPGDVAHVSTLSRPSESGRDVLRCCKVAYRDQKHPYLQQEMGENCHAVTTWHFSTIFPRRALSAPVGSRQARSVPSTLVCLCWSVSPGWLRQPWSAPSAPVHLRDAVRLVGTALPRLVGPAPGDVAHVSTLRRPSESGRDVLRGCKVAYRDQQHPYLHQEMVENCHAVTTLQFSTISLRPPSESGRDVLRGCKVAYRDQQHPYLHQEMVENCHAVTTLQFSTISLRPLFNCGTRCSDRGLR